MDGKTIMVAALALTGLAACSDAGLQGGGTDAAAAEVDPLVAAMGEGGDEFDNLGGSPPPFE